MKPDRLTRDYASARGETGDAASLADVRHGGRVRVANVLGGRAAWQRVRMVGIRPGIVVRVLHGPDRKGAVVGVGGARIALGRSVLSSIMVVPTDASSER